MGGYNVAQPTAAERVLDTICRDKLAKAEEHAVKASLLASTGLVPVAIAAQLLVR